MRLKLRRFYKEKKIHIGTITAASNYTLNKCKINESEAVSDIDDSIEILRGKS